MRARIFCVRGTKEIIIFLEKVYEKYPLARIVTNTKIGGNELRVKYYLHSLVRHPGEPKCKYLCRVAMYNERDRLVYDENIHFWLSDVLVIFQCGYLEWVGYYFVACLV